MATISTTEYAVLALLGEGQTHGFAIAKELEGDSEIGRVYTVRRPLVYRALERLVEAGLAEGVATEPGDGGPERLVHRMTPSGRQSLDKWMEIPVAHVRDLRLGFLLKVALLNRAGQSPLPLIRSQRAVLEPALDALANPDDADAVDLWRRHNATAAAAFLTDLEERYTV